MGKDRIGSMSSEVSMEMVVLAHGLGLMASIEALVSHLVSICTFLTGCQLVALTSGGYESFLSIWMVAFLAKLVYQF